MTTSGMEALLEGLTEPQRAAVCSDAAPLCVLAGAGSGKTRVLTRRVARRILDGSAQSSHLQVVTFTRKAAGELRDRLGRLGVAGPIRAGTFHAVAYAQLRQHWADQGRQPPVVLESPARLLRRILEQDTKGSRSPGGSADAARTAGIVAAEVSWAQAKLLGPEDYPAAARAAGRRPALGTTRVAELYARYGEEKRRRRVLDLDDLLTRCAQLVEDDPAVAAAQRWRLRHLFVDEMQDVNPAQWRLLIAWLAERDDLFVVGDPDQAVYSWNGADPSLLHRLPTLLPSTEVLRLETNYRSSPQILAAAQAVLEDTPGFARTVGGSPRDAARSEGPTPEIKAFQDEQAEAIALARWLRIAHRPGRPWSHLAVLARSNARLLPLAEALRRAEIPFRLRPPGAGEDPNRAVVLRSLQQFPPQTSLRSALAELVTAPALAGNVDRAGHTTILQGLGAAADELALDEPDPTVGSFLSWLAATGDGGWDDAGNTDRVELATFHRAKGLEWPVVAVIGLEDGLVPIGYATTPEALAEERRLLYVAITRAEEELWCSWSANRTTGEGTTRSCQPSPYLEALQAANAHLQSAPDVRKSARRVAELRDRLFSVAV